MANCGLVAGMAIPCRTFMSGIRKIYIAPFYSGASSNENITYTADTNSVITGITVSSGSFYAYDLTKEAGEVQDGIHVNATNGTVSFESTINIYLSQYSTAVRNKMVILAKGKLAIIVQDRNGQYFLYGTDGTGTSPSTSAGCDMGEGTATQGKAYAADPNGYNLTFNCIERVPGIEITSSLIAGITTIA